MKRGRRTGIYSLAFVVLSVFFLGFVSAADPGHSASSIASGTFESGDYFFPSNLNVSLYANATYFCLAGSCISSWGDTGLTVETQNIDDVLGNGSTTSKTISVGGLDVSGLINADATTTSIIADGDINLSGSGDDITFNGGVIRDNTDGVDIADTLDVSGTINADSTTTSISADGDIVLTGSGDDITFNGGVISDNTDEVDISDSLAVSGNLLSGTGNTVSSTDNIALGYGNTASNFVAIAIGDSNYASGDASIALGAYSNATSYWSLALGQGSVSSSTSSIAIGGYNATATSAGSVAIGGYDDRSYTLVGRSSGPHVSGVGSIGLGVNFSLDEDSAFAVGFSSTPTIFANKSGVGIGTRYLNNYGLNVIGEINSSGLCIGSECISDWSQVNGSSGILTETQNIDNVLGNGSSTTKSLIVGGLNASGNVGVFDGTVWFNGTTGTTPTSGPGTRLMWIPSKRAFRAGGVTGALWDNANMGSYSFAGGYDTNASGDYSAAFGWGSSASGSTSFASGYGTIASGSGSTASGSSSIANGSYSNAFGESVVASGSWSTSLGRNSIASGAYALASGNGAKALGTTSTAFGSSTASGSGSTASGSGSTASGTDSTAFGSYSVADGSYSFAAVRAKAYGLQSVAIGDYVSTGADSAFAFGEGAGTSYLNNTQADSAIFGWDSTSPSVFINQSGVGIGTTSLSGYALNVNGNANANQLCIGGECIADWTEINASSGLSAETQNIDDVLGNGSTTSKTISVGGVSSSGVINADSTTTAISADGDIVLTGSGDDITFNGGVISDNTDDVHINDDLYVSGYGFFTGSGSFAGANASGEYSFATGVASSASGGSSFATGVASSASGTGSFATGVGAKSSGFSSFASGSGSESNGTLSFASGYYSKAYGNYSVALGDYVATAADNTFVFGEGSGTSYLNNTNANSAIFGWDSTSPSVFINQSGVGIGTTSLNNYKLNVKADLNNQDLFRLSHPSSPTDAGFMIGFNTDGTTDNNVISMGIEYASTDYDVINIQRSTRNIGIGTTAPNYALDVRGQVNSSGLCIGSECISDWTEVNSSADLSGYVPYTGATTDVNLGGSYDLVNVAQLAVGTASPTAGTGLQVMSGTVWFNGTTGTTPTSGPGTRLMWIPGKGAFRSGTVTGGQWDEGSIGTYSFAGGWNTNASGSYSTAFGEQTTASGDYSLAIGSQTTASYNGAFAGGFSSTASSNVAFAFGANSVASGPYSWSVGEETDATKDFAIAWGYNTQATGLGSIGIGGYNNFGSVYVNGPQVSGQGSIGLGNEFSLNNNETFAVGFSSVPVIYANDTGLGVGTTETDGATFNVSKYGGDFVVILDFLALKI